MSLFQTITAWFLVIGLPVVALVGWLLNIIDLFSNNEGLARVALRVVGIFVFPLGCVLGYF